MAEDCTVVRFSREPSLARIENLKQIDIPDKFTENNQSFGVFYVFCITLSTITYAVDLILAFVLLYLYCLHGYGFWFALTLTFIVVPALLMTTISLRWYIIDHDHDDTSAIEKTSSAHWIIRIIFLLLQLSPLLRYIDTLVYGIKSKIAGATDNESQQTLLYRKMLDEDTNSSLLRLFHCFLHCAPQAIIQLVFLLCCILYPKSYELHTDIAVIQAWTVLVSIISIAWSLTSYHRSVRYSRDDKDKIQWVGLLVAFCWQLMSALSRILALSLLASKYPVWMAVVCALHWGVMSIWLALSQQQTAACSSRCEELLLSVALGLAYVLAFISPRDGPTRYVYLAYYLVCFMENTGALVVWCVSITNTSVTNSFLYYGAAGGQLLAFLLAIAFLLIYYRFCHPSVGNKSRIPAMDSGYLETDKPCYSKSTYNVRTSS